MAEAKIFAGPRVRRIRNGLGLTQAAMAEALGISPSYLNLIERNQRPLTVQLILKMASVYRIDIEDLRGEAGATITALKEVFADPLLAGEIPGQEELIEVAEAAPNAAQGMVKLYRAYREQAARLTDLAGLLAQSGHAAPTAMAGLPVDEVRARISGRPYFFDTLDAAAEAFHQKLNPGEDNAAAIREWLRAEHGIVVRTLPVHVMPNLRRRYDRHSMRLFLSERLNLHAQLQELAREACQIALRAEISDAIRELALSSAEAERIARFELARYAALALVMPYSAFLSAAQRSQYDLNLLAARFRVSFEQAASRLVTLQRKDAEGIPFFLMEVDVGGNRVREIGAAGFPHARFGGGCPKLGVYDAFAVPGQVLVDHAEMPDGSQYLLVARTVDGLVAGHGERVRRTAVMIGCDAAHAGQTVYGASLAPAGRVEIGRACRLCERSGCLARAEPPVTRPLGLDEMVTGLSIFDFQ